MIKNYFVYIMGLAYILAGLNHFRVTSFYVKMLTGLLPFPTALVYISGVAEILCGLGLMVPATRHSVAICTVTLLIAIFPANIYMAVHPERYKYPAIYLYLPLAVAAGAEYGWRIFIRRFSLSLSCK